MSNRVRVILDCEWDDLQHALDMVIAAKPAFDRSCRGPGWGWSYGLRGKPSLFVRRTKHGYSATADRRDSDRSGEAGETALAGSTVGESAGRKAASPKSNAHNLSHPGDR